MNVWQIIGGIFMIIASLLVIFVIILQQGRRAGGAGVITGGADTFLSKNKSRTMDATLARWTKYLAIGFFVLTIVMNVIGALVK